jgi:hypothetical protein
MKDTYGKRLYKCKCGSLQEQYVWETELNKHRFKCSECKKSLSIEDLNKQTKVEATSIRTPTRNR